MGIKLVVSDVDGTLVNDACKADQAFWALADEIKKRNIPFSLASGRPAGQTEELAKELHIQLPRIVSNGAGIYENGRFLFAKWIPGKAIAHAIKKADELGLAVYLNDGIEEGIYRDIPYTERKRNINSLPTPLIHPETEADFAALRLQKLMVIDPQKEGRVDEILPLLDTSLQPLEIVRYDSRCFEAMPKGCGKETGIQHLCEILGIQMEEVLAIGNHQNDIGMLNCAGVGAAVAGAVPALKKTADYVCHNDTAGGVLEAIRTFYETVQPETLQGMQSS